MPSLCRSTARPCSSPSSSKSARLSLPHPRRPLGALRRCAQSCPNARSAWARTSVWDAGSLGADRADARTSARPRPGRPSPRAARVRSRSPSPSTVVATCGRPRRARRGGCRCSSHRQVQALAARAELRRRSRFASSATVEEELGMAPAYRRRRRAASSSSSSANSRMVSSSSNRPVASLRTRLLTTSDSSTSRSALQIDSAASSAKPPLNTARRAEELLLARPPAARSSSSMRVPRAAGLLLERVRRASAKASSGRRLSSRVRSSSGLSSATRAAASSIASGRPSSRRQISPHGLGRPGIRAPTAAARSMNRATASLVRQRLDRVPLLRFDLQRLPARDQQPSCWAFPTGVTRPSARPPRSARSCRGGGGCAYRRCRRRGGVTSTAGRIAPFDQLRLAECLRGGPRRRRPGSSMLRPRAAWRAASSRCRPARSGSRGGERGRAAPRVPRAHVLGRRSASPGREIVRQRVRSGGKSPSASWKQPLRRSEVLEALLSEVAQPHRCVEQLPRRLRDKHLATVAGAHDPRRAVDVGARRSPLR